MFHFLGNFLRNLQLKIKNKILLLVITAVFVSCGILFLCTFMIYSNSIEKKAINYNLTEINTINKNMDLYFNQIEYTSYTLAYNPLIQNYLIFHSISSEEENSKKAKEIVNVLSILSIVNKDLQLTLFPYEKDDNFYTSGYSAKSSYNFREDSWYKLMQSSNKQKEVLTENPQNYLDPIGRKPVYTFAYKCNSFGNQNILGYILMDIDKNRIEQFFKTNTIEIKSTLITDQNQKLLYSSDKSFDFNNISAYLPTNSDQGYMTKTINGSKYLIIFGTSKFTGWKIINLMPYESLYKDMRFMKYLISFISLLLLFITIGITYRFTNLITDPIEKLKAGMSEVMKGNFNSSIKDASQDEIGELINYFNRMIYEIQSLIKEAESSKYLKKEAQLKALQHQINPHFLYNTLEMIIGLAHSSDGEKVKIICRNLGAMFRYNLSSKKIVTIDEELAHIKRYIYIMEQRFEGRFKTYYEVDENLLNYKTLKFFLQPLVENSLSYGFANFVEGGEIKIKIHRKDDKIEFNILDNGQGFTKETLEKICLELQSSFDTPTEYIDPDDHIGIMNVHLRFLMLFKQDYHIHIFSTPLKKTCVQIQIPIVE